MMKLHFHVPKLVELAIYVVCEDIVRHGAQQLVRPMPRPLYHWCISAFAEHHVKEITMPRLFHSIMSCNYLDDFDTPCDLRAAMCILDHVVLQDVDVDGIIDCLITASDADVDGVIECIHRFAARCLASNKHDMMMGVMNNALKIGPCRAIREILIHYGAVCDTNDLLITSLIGDTSAMSSAASTGVSTQQFNTIVLKLSIRSGNIDAVKWVIESRGPQHLDDGTSVDGRDLSVNMLEALLSFGIFTTGHHYTVENIRSTHVLRWLLDHDVIDTSSTLRQMAVRAATHGGIYAEILYYMVEQAHTAVPRDVLPELGLRKISDLTVVDYLISHGADVNELAHHEDDYIMTAPLYLRYWLDVGLNMLDYDDDEKFNYVKCCVRYAHCIPVVVMEMLGIDVNAADDSYTGNGMSLLHIACLYRKTRSAQVLIEQGADVDAVDDNGRTPLHIACHRHCSDIVEILIDAGADQYAEDDDGYGLIDIIEGYGDYYDDLYDDDDDDELIDEDDEDAMIRDMLGIDDDDEDEEDDDEEGFDDEFYDEDNEDEDDEDDDEDEDDDSGWETVDDDDDS